MCTTFHITINFLELHIFVMGPNWFMNFNCVVGVFRIDLNEALSVFIEFGINAINLNDHLGFEILSFAILDDQCKIVKEVEQKEWSNILPNCDE